MAKFFDDIGKDGEDLLEKGFPSAGSIKYSAKVSTYDGVTSEAYVRKYFEEGKQTVEARVQPKFEYKKDQVEVALDLSTNEKYQGDITYKTPSGAKVTVSALSNNNVVSVATEASLKTDQVAAKVKVSQPITKENQQTVLEGSAVASLDKRFLAGTSLKYELSNASLSWATRLGLIQPDFQGTIFLNSQKKKEVAQLIVGFSWFHKISNILSAGFKVSTDARNTVGPAGVVGLNYKFDASTFFKTKLSYQSFPDSQKSSEVRLGLGLKEVIGSTTLTLGADLNARQLAGFNKGADSTYGLEIQWQG